MNAALVAACMAADEPPYVPVPSDTLVLTCGDCHRPVYVPPRVAYMASQALAILRCDYCVAEQIAQG